MSAELPTPEDHLHRFGLDSFRPGQKDVIDAVIRGDDCLCIMPTGGGKSLCYQLPSVARPGTTLVVSPLIALMKDQVDSLSQLGISAAFVNSALTGAEQDERLLRFASGEYDLFYVAPERFRSPRFRDAVRKTKIQLLAIDEAHCISEWGHDFRHEYARLGEFRAQLGSPQTIALTATATTDVRDDVLRQLELPDPKIFVAGFARDNLYYKVQNVRSKQAKHQALIDFLEKTPGCGIIYTSTRSACEEVRDVLLNESKRKVIAYHGGLLPDERRQLQDVFMSGQAEIVVATNAFGMGIDKADVRFVVHFNIPGSLEAYYQEAGRAGRDGLQSICYLLYSQNDRFIQEFFIDSAHPPKESIKKVYDYLCRHPDDPIELTQRELKEQLDLSIGPDGVGTCERLLEKAGVLERLDSNRNLAAVRIESDAPNLAELLPSQAKVQRRVARAVGTLVTTHRFERFYFHPKDISTLCGEDATAVTRALRELNRYEWFDYVPPFRGRAVHMLRKDQSFHELEVDYTRLEERRKSNLGKLDRVIRFATTRRCRQRDILRYFGETTSEKCGHCDNCGAAPKLGIVVDASKVSSSNTDSIERESEVSPAMMHMVRIVLSGVARAQGRFGKTNVVGMLCGSQSAKIKKWRLDELSTFGLLENFKQSEVNDVIESLIAMSIVKMVEADRFRPTIHNADLGNEIMMGRALLEETPEVEPSLIRKIDRVFRHVPPVVVQPLPEKDSEEDAEEAPKEGADDGTADTTGDTNEDEGDTEESTEPNAASEVETQSKPESEPSQGGKPAIDSVSVEKEEKGDARQTPEGETRPSYYWTWLLLRDGYSLDDCLAIRKCRRTEAIDHLIQAAEDAHQIDLRWVIDENSLNWLDEQTSDDNSIRPLMDSLPPPLTPQLVTLFSKCRAKQDSASKSSA